MGLKMPVPDPTEKELHSVQENGFEEWYRQRSGYEPNPLGFLFQSEALSLIRLANHYKNLAENARLRSELAAIRDAGDEEIERMELEIAHWIDNEAKCVDERVACREARDELQNLADIAKSRGARIRELEEDIGCYEAMKEGFSSRLADVEKERDEAIYLLRCCYEEIYIKNVIEVLASSPKIPSELRGRFVRIKELTAKREGE